MVRCLHATSGASCGHAWAIELRCDAAFSRTTQTRQLPTEADAAAAQPLCMAASSGQSPAPVSWRRRRWPAPPPLKFGRIAAGTPSVWWRYSGRLTKAAVPCPTGCWGRWPDGTAAEESKVSWHCTPASTTTAAMTNDIRSVQQCAQQGAEAPDAAAAGAPAGCGISMAAAAQAQRERGGGVNDF